MNPATEFVYTARELSPVHAYVADHGEVFDSSGINHVTIAGRPVTVSSELTDEERALVAEAIRATEPTTQACFANSLDLWAHEGRFKYVEGFANASDLPIDAFEHAWCLLDGEKLVDVTSTFDHYHGVVITADEVLQRHYDLGRESGIYGVIGNHRNRFQFLRERDYIDG